MKNAPPTTPKKEWTLESAIKQLEYCDYETEAGKLVWNDAFIWLKNIHTNRIHAEEMADKLSDALR